ncbi:MAG: DUF2155 domain-containing protein [Alphaproteobacteria bacterium]|nr:DUF2155 domain-containing protein [Alphaproteobacteria bacterium]
MAAPARAEDISLEQVVLRGLDKVTGRLSTMTVKVGEKTTFGALDIYVRVCYAHPPEETPENAAYLDVVENKEEGQLKLFSGFMFSSSPALSAMDHAVYDVWVLKCQGEPFTAPKPEPLVLESPIEPAPIQPKLKIILEEEKKPAADEEWERQTDGEQDGEELQIQEAVIFLEDRLPKEEGAAEIESFREISPENE